MVLAAAETAGNQGLRAVEMGDADVMSSVHQDVPIGPPQRGAGDDQMLARFTGAVDLIGAALLLTDRWCKPAAAVLGLWTIFLGIWFHRFWAVDSAHWQPTVDDFFHHFVMTGAFIYIAMVGAGRASRGNLLARSAAA